MKTHPLPPCPKCDTAKHVIAIGLTGETFHCDRCAGLFDRQPDEGGDYSDRNPAARLERQERKPQRRSFPR